MIYLTVALPLDRTDLTVCRLDRSIDLTDQPDFYRSDYTVYTQTGKMTDMTDAKSNQQAGTAARGYSRYLAMTQMAMFKLTTAEDLPRWKERVRRVLWRFGLERYIEQVVSEPTDPAERVQWEWIA